MAKALWLSATFMVLVCGMPEVAAHPVAVFHESLDSKFQAAVELYNSGQYQQAVNELEILAGEIPSSFEVHELLGLAYAAESKDAEARVHFEKAILLKPDSSAARANLAVNLSRLGEKDLAEAQFKKAIAASPSDFQANHEFGEFYAHGGNIAAAVPYLEKAQRARPDAYANGYDLALAYEKTGKFDAARRQLQDLIQRQDTAELHNLLGAVEEKKGNYVVSAKEYERAAQMDPSESNIFDWGAEFLLHHTWDAAVEVFAQGAKRYPKSSALAVGLGMSYYWSGEFKSAVKALILATDLAPADPHPYYFLSKAYKRAPVETSEVIARFRRLESLRPNDPHAAFYCAVSLWKGEEMKRSGAELGRIEELLKRAVQLDPSFADAYLELGNFYSQEHRYAEAVPAFRRALQLDPNLANAYYSLGQAYVHLGKKDLAEKEFAAHQKVYNRHLAEDDREREQIRQFVLSMESGATNPQRAGVGP